jgi:hypothetical protein
VIAASTTAHRRGSWFVAAFVFLALGTSSRPGDAAVLYGVAFVLFLVGITEKRR